MPFVIAVAGKGGTGKSTVAGLLTRALRRAGRTPILAVDADPNTTLDAVLGLHPARTVSDVLDATKGLREIPNNIPRTTYMEMQLVDCLAEGRGVDLVVMGLPEGAGCYCAANHLLREHLDRLMSSYPSVVMDNAAGMEHLSRRTTRNVDHLLIVSDPSVPGLRAAQRIAALVRDLDLAVRETALILNRADRTGPGLPDRVPAPLEDLVAASGVRLAGIVPLDPTVMTYELDGRPLLELPDDALAARAVAEILEALLPAGVAS